MLKKVLIVLLVVIVSFNLIACTPFGGFRLSKGRVTIKHGTTYQLECDWFPSFFYRDVMWESSDESIATVSDDGLVEGVNLGECTITVTTKDGMQQSCVITVRKNFELYNYNDFNVVDFGNEEFVDTESKILSVAEVCALAPYVNVLISHSIDSITIEETDSFGRYFIRVSYTYQLSGRDAVERSTCYIVLRSDDRGVYYMVSNSIVSPYPCNSSNYFLNYGTVGLDAFKDANGWNQNPNSFNSECGYEYFVPYDSI